VLTECATWGSSQWKLYLLDYNENHTIQIPEHIRWDLIQHNTHTTFPHRTFFFRSSRVILAKKKKPMQVEFGTQWRGSNMMDFSQILFAGLVRTNRVCGGRDGTGWACGPHTRTECIYLSIYLLIESQSRLKFNGPTDPSLHTTSCFVPSGATKRQWPSFGEPPKIFIYFLSDGPIKLAQIFFKKN